MFLKSIFFLIVGFILWFGGLVWFIEDMPQETNRTDLKAEAIVVLTGGQGRIAKGLKLLSQQKSNQIIISGVQKSTSLKAVVRASGYKGAFNHKQITLDHQSASTIENAQNVTKWVKTKKIKSILLVTANYHMRRALIEFNQYMKGVEIIPYPINPLDSARNSWCNNYKIFCLYLNEYQKYLGAMMLRFMKGKTT